MLQPYRRRAPQIRPACVNGLLGLVGCAVLAGGVAGEPRQPATTADLAEGNPQRAGSSQRQQAVAALNHVLPRRPGFERNQGQFHSAVRFAAREANTTLFLTAGEAVWRLRHRDESGARASTVRMRWLGANPAPEVLGTEPAPGKVNYIIGSRPQGWRYGVPLYGRVIYRDLYPGIDLIFHDRRGELEYDFVVAPGVDPGAIRLQLRHPTRAQ